MPAYFFILSSLGWEQDVAHQTMFTLAIPNKCPMKHNILHIHPLDDASDALCLFRGFWISLGFYFIATAGGIIPESGPHGLQMAFSLAGLFNFGYFM